MHFALTAPPSLSLSLVHRFQSLVNDVAALGNGIEKIAQRCTFQQDILEQSTVSLLQDTSGILHTVPVSLATHIIGNVCVCVRVCMRMCQCLVNVVVRIRASVSSSPSPSPPQ